jgi:PAS domain-containing protein
MARAKVMFMSSGFGMKDLSIKLRLSITVIVLILGFSVFGLATLKEISSLSVNGPYYLRIVQGKDILADVLPPPKYIIESYLVTLQLSLTSDPAKIEYLSKRLQQLKTEYDTRQQFWQSQRLEPELQLSLLDKSDQSAKSFYAEVEKNFLPALKNRHQDDIGASLKLMEQAYEQHRGFINEVVSYSTERNHQDELNAAVAIAAGRKQLLWIFSVSVLTALGLAILTSRSTLSSLRVAQQVANAIADGDLDFAFDTSEKSEIGDLLRSLKIMQQQISERTASNMQLCDESSRLKMALDNINSNVIVADDQRKIIYLNPAMENMLHGAEEAIRREMPHFDVTKLVGSCMDEFHSHPSIQLGLLANLSHNHKAEVEVAGRTFQLLLTQFITGGTNGSGQWWNGRTGLRKSWLS